MDYTLANLVKALKSRLQDDEYDVDDLKRFLNESQFEILGDDKYSFLEKIDNVDANSAGELDLPYDYQSTLYVFARKEKHDPREQLAYISPSEFFDQTRNRDFTYTVYGNTLFYKLPKKYNNDGECDCCGWHVMHLYLAKPKIMKKDGDKPIIPYEYQEALLLGALARAEQRRDNFDYAQIYFNKQNDLLVNMKLRYGPGQQSFENCSRLPFGVEYNGIN